MSDIAQAGQGFVHEALNIAADLCDAQALSLTFKMSQVAESPQIQLTAHQHAQIRTQAKIEMARELAVSIRNLTK